MIAGKNWRNLRVLMLGVLIAGNIVFHLEVIGRGSAGYGIRLGIAGAASSCWSAGASCRALRTTGWCGTIRVGCRGSSRDSMHSRWAPAGCRSQCGIVLPQLAVSGVVLMIAGVLQTARLARWAGDPTFADRLVLVLHTRFMASHTNCFASKRESTHPSHLPCNPYELDADCLFQLCDPVDCFLEAVVAE
jgi:uncharacterized protein involved in response to NO